ncbi:MAG: UDP-N-acetylmuramoyl-L-alanyl-D-glutamate--2,6-diaminopimelate ligase [Flavobacteriales bacterium]|nr:UDP-N-acetylmuramoyl-L-alanyl-D-glutamate--2,6-diaminopimelate ligase [Flavobacteriales bacterium]MCW8913846.1 UDP-N-acetylmuramoyl-L-alanyl-D-glutamate--2,6-diaminopimelate ligase [Flavobacteriales bacterium]MCW8937962.1 UDP-N-acetylmuramoyl-L-alanyl-D-glutamate--2,6-diaminopimelate ligase [Flavobacteriales bacterium]MCW8968413.1 UDP-N-acetylmuramoyl-L-alanyl-D-glutamate--2,6-diaminopimelate ligase [Flavobacteriales bacterium]MCW8989659.1 UDP-N-acetylmuramoyl-L-alanyl-D-glutamate--2,6-diami
MNKLLKDILYKTGIEELVGNTNIAIDKICFDSREVEDASLFVAVVGTATDGHQYINQTIEKGAVAIVCEHFPEQLHDGITYVKVKDSAAALGIIAANFYDNPSNELKLVGITGTNGKTTTATLLHELFVQLGYQVGLLSTVVNKIGNDAIPSTHTTPNAVELNKLLRKMVEAGCDYCFMEVSSHAIHQHRVTGVAFSGAVFTNITHDHLDYHKTFDEYIKAKKMFFDMLPENAFALVNKDDKNGMVMLQNTKAKPYTFALKSAADFTARILESGFSGMMLHIDKNEVWTKLIGGFNVYNLLSIYAVAVLLEQDKLNTLTAISNLNAVEGRFQYIKSQDNISGIVDYAHTPDALKNVLGTISEIRTNNETVITVVGCGGDRDKTKRPLMAQIACEYSNKVILTSDNPRSENPEQIINDMKAGVEPQHYKKVLSITNREEAIKTACMLAESNDIILVAGKGHEKYQEINGEKFPFDDLEILKKQFSQ